jgi:hypothetical protein
MKNNKAPETGAGTNLDGGTKSEVMMKEEVGTQDKRGH